MCKNDMIGLRNDYLEQKKKYFPRFYFVANGALLDILSNGNKPLKAGEMLTRTLCTMCLRGGRILGRRL